MWRESVTRLKSNEEEKRSILFFLIFKEVQRRMKNYIYIYTIENMDESIIHMEYKEPGGRGKDFEAT